MDAAGGAIQFVEHHADNAGASVVDELLNESGFVHEEEVEEASLPMREEYQGWARKRGQEAPLSHFFTKPVNLVKAIHLQQIPHSNPCA